MIRVVLAICSALPLLFGSALANTAAVALVDEQVDEQVDAELERRIAAGRLQTRLEQDLQLLQSIQALVKAVESLSVRAELAAALLGTSPDTVHLRTALQHNNPPSHTASVVDHAPRYLPPPEAISLVFLQVSDAHRLGKVILRIGERYVMAHVGSILQLGGISHKLHTIGADHALLKPVAGGAVRRVNWFGSSLEQLP